MAISALGKIPVPVPGTPVAVKNFVPADWINPNAAEKYPCHGIMFQALAANNGAVYVGTSVMNKTTLAGVFAVLPTPTDSSLPTFSVALTISPNGLRAEVFYIDADQAGDGVLCTALYT